MNASEARLYEAAGLVIARNEAPCNSRPERDCVLMRGHDGGHWHPCVVEWLGLSDRCADRGGECWRAEGHKGDHEGPTGKTWRRKRADR